MTRREAPVSPPVVLTIAGSDSGGGAGIQADLKTIEACGGFGTSAITSATAQNTQGVQGSHLLPIADIEAQIEAVCADFDVAAVKTGMLATSDVIELVAAHADALPNLVVDPVMVAASGDRLLAEEAEDAYEQLLAEAALVTPNADEAAVLTGVAVEDAESAEHAGRLLVDDHGADAALVKGGHVPGDDVVDVLVTEAATSAGATGDAATDDAATDGALGVTTFRHERIDTDATHGSGCTLSSAIATRLAHGDDLATAVGAGVDLLARAVRYGVDVGEGPGSVHHLVALRNDASRTPTADLVASVADRLRADGHEGLAPASGLGVAGATPHAEEPADVAAVPGRLAAADLAEPDRPDSSNAVPVRYRGDDPLASLLLAAREADPAVRFAALVRADAVALLDGPSVAADDVAAAIDGSETGGKGPSDGMGPVDAAALAPVRSADGSPAAVRIDADARADEPKRVVVLGESTAELLERLS